MDGSRALALIRKEKLFGLCGPGGCLCLNFEVHGVHVDVSCRKSSAAIERVAPDFYGIKVRVHSRHMDRDGKELRAIADEVAAQLAPEGYAIIARFCEYRIDADMLCAYCERPRENSKGYLCQKCLGSGDAFGGSIAEQHDFRRHDFQLSEPE